MKKLLGIVLIGLLWCNVGFAEKKSLWEIKETDKHVFISVNGTIYSEHMFFVLKKNNKKCEYMDIYFDVFNPNEKQLDIDGMLGQKLKIKSSHTSGLVNSEIIGIHPSSSSAIGERDKSYSYLANDRQVYLSFAENVLINKYDLKKLSKDILRVEIVEHQSFNPKLYFADEFLFNEWNLEKLNDYIRVGLKRCEI